ncbi:MAG: hypothetical protein OXN89_22600 [Bryobacterales bacterium]|nr:hypothetical protein [Bryobacterales bacterium]
MPGPLASQRNTRVTDLLSLFPDFLGNGINKPGSRGRSERYRSLQLQPPRLFANGFNFVTGCNFRRARNDHFYDDVDEVDWVLTFQDDIRGRPKFPLAGVYELPSGRTNSVGAKSSGLADKILRGWQLCWMYT